MKIVMLDALSVSDEIVSQYTKKYKSLDIELITCSRKLTSTEKIELSKDADILIVTNGEFPNEIIEKAEKLKLISVGFTGVDHIPLKECNESGILVCNSQGYATMPTAELALTLMLNRTRYLSEVESRVRLGLTKDGLVGTELSFKTVGIIGTGQIGLQLARLLKGFSVNLIAFDPVETKAALDLGIKYLSLTEVFEQSDFISLHLPLNKSTTGLVNEELISKMKPTSILINCARGLIVDQLALKNALDAGDIRGAGIDVFEIEPPLPLNHILMNSNNLTLTPHIAFASKESMLRRAEIVFGNIDSFLSGKPTNIMS